MKERSARQRRIEGIGRDMRAFEARVDALFVSLERELDEQMSKDATMRLLNKELKSVQSADAALIQSSPI